MQYVKRGRGSHRSVCLCAIAALGVALSACGGGSGSSSSAAATTQSSTETAQSATATASPAPAPSTSTAASTPPPAPASSESTAPPPPTATVGAVTLNWLPPTENVDDSPLTNLAGYDIRYGTASGKYTQRISVSNPGIATYVVSDLAPGTYYFSVASVNSDGTESPPSPEVRATVN